MANPNIALLQTIRGTTTGLFNLNTTSTVSPTTTLLLNNVSNGVVFKINTIIACLKSTTTTATITLSYHTGASITGTEIAIASKISIPLGSSLVLVGKDAPIYLEENRSIGVKTFQSGNPGNNLVDIICSYELISQSLV